MCVCVCQLFKTAPDMPTERTLRFSSLRLASPSAASGLSSAFTLGASSLEDFMPLRTSRRISGESPDKDGSRGGGGGFFLGDALAGGDAGVVGELVSTGGGGSAAHDETDRPAAHSAAQAGPQPTDRH